MKVDLGWGIVALLVLAVVIWRLSSLAGRIDRLHHRIELARVSLDAQLLRRARAVEALAASGRLDPASAIVLAQAASHSRNADKQGPVERGIIESELSRDLREVFAYPEPIDALRATPDGAELLSDLAAACSQVTLSRRFLNDGVQAARLLRQEPLVRLFRLAGSAPRPEMFEMDDAAPSDLGVFP